MYSKMRTKLSRRSLSTEFVCSDYENLKLKTVRIPGATVIGLDLHTVSPECKRDTDFYLSRINYCGCYRLLFILNPLFSYCRMPRNRTFNTDNSYCNNIPEHDNAMAIYASTKNKTR
jgi:hypothetical protein